MSARTERDTDLAIIQENSIVIQERTQKITRYTTRARANGATWQQIGDALGITKQAAQQRYGHKDHWTAADTAAGQTPSMFSSHDVAPLVGLD